MASKRRNAEYGVFASDIVILGGGPAGISTWLHLHKYSPRLADRTLVIEKAVFPRDKVCAGGVGACSADVLEHLGVALDIPSLFVSDVEFKFGEETYCFHKPNCFRIVRRTDFDHALVKTALNRGLVLNEDEMLVDLDGDQHGLTVKTDKRRYSARILVGADGALSIVRRKMMATHRPRLAPTIQTFSPVDPQLDIEFHQEKMVLDFTPAKEGLQGYVWHFPCLKAGAPSMVHGICDFRIYLDRPRAGMKKILDRELQSRNIPPNPKSWASHPIHWLSEEAVLSRQNILLVGDAAGIEPAFGGGIHIALSYGDIAARAIIHAFQNNDFSFHDYKQRIQSHMVGRYISECTGRALEMYSGGVNPLKSVREFFMSRSAGTNPLFLLLARHSLRHK